MIVSKLGLEGVLLVEPRVFRDPRGSFLEAWNESAYEAAGIRARFVQDNVSHSIKGVVRGLHYQHPHPQAKLVTVLRGEVFDVVVDIRRGSPTFGQWEGVTLNAERPRFLLIPEGFAHGFAVTSDEAVFSYKCTDFYRPECDGGLLWDDPALGITWPVTCPLLSQKDRDAPRLSEIPTDRLPEARGRKTSPGPHSSPASTRLRGISRPLAS